MVKDPDDLARSIDEQIRRQGVACYRVSDGQVLVLPRATLQLLMDKCDAGEGDGPADRVILFIKQGPAASTPEEAQA